MLPERFWKKVEKGGPVSPACPDLGPCWVWTAALVDGYAVFHVGEKLRAAHQLTFEEERGPVPEGLELDHLCRVRRCVNPAHLDPVTHAVNLGRGERARRSHCVNGHPFDAANTRFRRSSSTRSTGGRECRACVYERKKKARERSAP